MSGGSWLHWRRRRGRLRLGRSAEADGRRGDAFRRPAERPSQPQEHRVNVLGSGMTRHHFSPPAGVRLCRAQALKGGGCASSPHSTSAVLGIRARPFAPKAGRGLEAESATHDAPRPGCRPEAPRRPCLPCERASRVGHSCSVLAQMSFRTPDCTAMIKRSPSKSDTVLTAQPRCWAWQGGCNGQSGAGLAGRDVDHVSGL